MGTKGQAKTGGRQKGSHNKITGDLKAAILETFAEMGGVPALLQWAKENRNEFYMQIWAKLIPRDLGVKGDLGLGINVLPSLADAMKAARERVRNGKRELVLDVRTGVPQPNPDAKPFSPPPLPALPAPAVPVEVTPITVKKEVDLDLLKAIAERDLLKAIAERDAANARAGRTFKPAPYDPFNPPNGGEARYRGRT